jgi:hypothetical protein
LRQDSSLVRTTCFRKKGNKGASGDFSTPRETEEVDGFFYGEASGAYRLAASGGGAGVSNKSNEICLATKVGVPTHGLNGPHGLGMGICGGIVARGAQGQFPDCFCLKTRCGFVSHSSKNYLSKLEQGGFYVKENDSHGYCKLFLSSEAAKLAPEGLLESHNNMHGWKAIICQLEDQLAAGPTTEQAVAVQAEGLLDFADRMLKTPYTATPMQPSRRRQHDSLEDGDNAEDSGKSKNGNDVMSLLQRLEDSIGCMRGKLGVWTADAHYLTLHGGMASLGKEHASLHQDVLGISHKLKATGQQAEGSRVKVH